MTPTRQGLLVLVVGPSGAGKDTLMDAARTIYADDSRFVFVQRHITRPLEAGGERHHPIAPDAFQAEVACGRYCLSWGAHGLWYGVPCDVLHDVGAGCIAVVNGSRKVLPDVEALGVPAAVILVTARPEVLAERLAGRGRETEAQIRERLAREASLAATTLPVIEVTNDGTREAGAARFCAALADLSRRTESVA